MGTSENDFSDFYHDDPTPQIPKNKLPSKFITTGALILGSILFFQGTFAGNVSLNSGSGVEFGQGVSQAVACSGNTDLTLTPRSSFTNGSPGAHYLNSVTVSNIPTSCYGADFTISAYNDSSGTPLALFNTSSTAAVIYNNAGAFSRGLGSTGMTVASSTGTFTATFTAPVAQSSDVFKLTIQSGAHTPYYYVGSAGPGGGFVYYVNDAGFNCGPTLAASCKYLEVAPSGWNTGSDPNKVWATGTSSSGNASADISTITNDASAYNNILGVGLGYKNSVAIVDQNGAAYDASSNNYAAGAARAYAGGSQSDWYLPTTAELNLLCQWRNGIAPSVTTRCTGGSTNSATYGAGSAGFADSYFWSSSEYNTSNALNQSFYNGAQSASLKSITLYVRPVRAF
ncbi:DUF1566 domain-containing protein [Candidatus Planktophila versatilis]|uniref:Lcl domain-containing protein n=1 Tax=Candidatus Planktophila versatilis TaxID=1884905 RepID=UPI003CEF47D5